MRTERIALPQRMIRAFHSLLISCADRFTALSRSAALLACKRTINRVANRRIEIRQIEIDQYVNFSTEIQRTVINYEIYSTAAPAAIKSLLTDPTNLPDIPLPSSYTSGGDPEFLVQHRPYLGVLEPRSSYQIPAPPPQSERIPCSVLEIEALKRALTNYQDRTFEFTLEISERIDIKGLINDGLLRVNRGPDEQIGVEKVTVSYQAMSSLGPVPLKDVVIPLEDLGKNYVWDVRVDGIQDDSWHLEIGKIGSSFSYLEYERHLKQALSEAGVPTSERIPKYLQGNFHNFDVSDMSVCLIIDEVAPNKPVSIRFTQHCPEKELLHRTGIEDLDHLMINIHARLLELGMPAECEYQKVLAGLLKYQKIILSGRKHFVDPVKLRRNERSFHDDLYDKLCIMLDFGPIEYEVSTGNSRIDLRISKFPVELKLERRDNVDTQEIIAEYQNQAADYVGRCGSYVGFLVVLDAVAFRQTPTPPTDQDVRVVKVLTSSGSDVCLVGIIIRLPRPPSQFSKN